MSTFEKYLILETRNLYEKSAQDAVHIIFPNIKKILLKNNPPKEETITFSVNKVFPKLVYSTVSIVKITITRTTKEKVKVSAEYSLNDDIPGIDGMIDIHMIIPISLKEDNYNLLETIYYKLANVIRHELEHAAQSDRGKEEGKIFKNIFDIKNQFFSIKSHKEDEKINMKKFENKMKYLNHPDEIEAWASSMYMIAKKQKESFMNIFNKTMYGFFSSNNEEEFNKKISNIKPENKKIILFQLHNWRKNIANYAKKRYPNIIL